MKRPDLPADQRPGYHRSKAFSQEGPSLVLAAPGRAFSAVQFLQVSPQVAGLVAGHDKS